jgi:hypothetical protein
VAGNGPICMHMYMYECITEGFEVHYRMYPVVGKFKPVRVIYTYVYLRIFRVSPSHRWKPSASLLMLRSSRHCQLRIRIT